MLDAAVAGFGVALAQQARPGLARQRPPDPAVAACGAVAAPPLPLLEAGHASKRWECAAFVDWLKTARLNRLLRGLAPA